MSQIFVDGNYRSVSGGLRTVINPANSQVLGEVAECQDEDVALAVTAAQHALPAWSALSEDDRYSTLQAASDALQARSETLSALLVAEGGLTQREARATLAAALTDLRYPSANVPQRASAVRAVIGPASSPLLPIVRQVTAALMAGDTAVVSPAKGAVLTNLAMCVVGAALPAGVVNVLAGEVAGGQRLAGHPGIQAISYTGSAAVAAALAQAGKPIEAWVGAADVAIVRLEQLYPFPGEPLAARIKRMPALEEVVWCQEEPRNNGSWFFVEPLIEESLAAAKCKVARPRYAGRTASASPATGLAKRHAAEQAALVSNALGLSVRGEIRRRAKG